jgi:hypothetical protein
VARNRFTGKIERWGQPFGDPEINLILHRLVMNGVAARKRDLVEAVDVVAEQYAFNPAIDWLESLPSKGDGYMARLFTEYIPSALPKMKADGAWCIKYLEIIGRCFCLSVVERLYSPGAFINCVPVLLCEPWMGIYALSELMPDVNWFAHDIPSLLGAEPHLVGKMLAALPPPRSRGSIERLTAFAAQRGSRTCALVVVTETAPWAARWFRPLQVKGTVECDQLAADHQALWAEARDFHRAHRTERPWLLPLDIDAAQALTDSERIDHEVGALLDRLGQYHCATYGVRVADIARDIDLGHLTEKAAEMAISTALRKRGYYSRQERRPLLEVSRPRLWYPGDASKPRESGPSADNFAVVAGD